LGLKGIAVLRHPYDAIKEKNEQEKSRRRGAGKDIQTRKNISGGKTISYSDRGGESHQRKDSSVDLKRGGESRLFSEQNPGG